MITQAIKLTEDKITFRSDAPRHIGTKMGLEILLPEGAPLRSFIIHGTVTGCKFVNNDGYSGYILEMKIGDVSAVSRKILKAYVDYLETEDILKEVNVDFEPLQEELSNLEEKLIQLRAVLELIRNNVEGISELLKKSSDKSVTIH